MRQDAIASCSVAVLRQHDATWIAVAIAWRPDWRHSRDLAYPANGTAYRTGQRRSAGPSTEDRAWERAHGCIAGARRAKRQRLSQTRPGIRLANVAELRRGVAAKDAKGDRGYRRHQAGPPSKASFLRHATDDRPRVVHRRLHSGAPSSEGWTRNAIKGSQFVVKSIATTVSPIAHGSGGKAPGDGRWRSVRETIIARAVRPDDSAYLCPTSDRSMRAWLNPRA